MMEKFRKFAHLTLAAMVALVSVFGGLIGAVPIALAQAQTVGLNLPRIPWKAGRRIGRGSRRLPLPGGRIPIFFLLAYFCPIPVMPPLSGH